MLCKHSCSHMAQVFLYYLGENFWCCDYRRNVGRNSHGSETRKLLGNNICICNCAQRRICELIIRLLVHYVDFSAELTIATSLTPVIYSFPTLDQIAEDLVHVLDKLDVKVSSYYFLSFFLFVENCCSLEMLFLLLKFDL